MHACRAIHVNDRTDSVGHVGLHVTGEAHIRVIRPLRPEILPALLLQHRGRERPEFLPIFNAGIYQIPHLFVTRGGNEPNSRSFAPDRCDRDSARNSSSGDGLRVIVIDIDDRGTAIRQQFVKQSQFGGKIGFEARMIVEVVARDIGESRRRNAQSIEPILIEPMR